MLPNHSCVKFWHLIMVVAVNRMDNDTVFKQILEPNIFFGADIGHSFMIQQKRSKKLLSIQTAS